MNGRGAYYNEFDPFAAEWLRNLINAGLIPSGDVDERSIVDVRPDDLAGYRQCHFFAGIGGWALAARLAGWPDDREIWTGSPPCQPFSVAGKGKAQADDRHLWPHLFRLVSARRPAVLMGEQVAAAVGKHWLDGALADLAGIDYAGRAVVVPACAVNAPHRRDRLWFVADANGARLEGRGLLPECGSERIAGASGVACGVMADTDIACTSKGRQQRGGEFGLASGDPTARSAWHGAGWIIGHDRKARRVEPGIRLLAHGVPGRVGKLRAYGNAIVPQVAAEVIAAFLESERGTE